MGIGSLCATQRELKLWPAHTRDAACRFSAPFEITPELEGTGVLFDFMGPGDILDLLISVSTIGRHGRSASSRRRDAPD